MTEQVIVRSAIRLALLAGVAGVSACASPSLRHPNFGQACAALAENADVACVSVFYGTNRRIDFDPAEPASVFVHNERGAGLILGVADVWTPLEVKDGELRERGVEPRPPRDNLPPEAQEHYFYVTRISGETEQVFVTTLGEAVGRAGARSSREDDDRSLLLFVHGFNVEFEEALIKTAQLAFDLQYPYPPRPSAPQAFDPGVPVAFSWPSRGSLFAYGADEREADEADQALREFLNLLLSDRLDVERVNIVAHSMGNRVLTATLRDFAQEYRRLHQGREVEFRIIVAAADVDRSEFEAAAAHFSAYDPEVAIYTSNNDFAMYASEIVNRAVNEITGRPRARLGDSDGNNPFVYGAEGYVTIDTTSVAPSDVGFGHGYYANNEAVLNDARCALADVPEEARALEQAMSDENLPYFRARPLGAGRRDSSCDLSQPTRFAERAGPDEAELPPPVTPPPPPPPPPPVAVCPTAELVVYFEWDRSNLTSEGVSSVDAAVSLARQCDIAQIVIVGHTDSSGDLQYNQELSERRAGVVRDALVARGVAVGVIDTQARGETDPAMATADGVREPLNRRATVTIRFR